MWSDKTALKLIDNGQPFLFSLAIGIYFNHTVAVYGYRIYTNNRTGHQYTFLMLAESGLQPRVKILRDLYMPDGLHPNDEGHQKIADRLMALLDRL